MADFSVRSDSVDVEQIMRQIRARIREKRGADYTESELQQLATVKLEKFLDPRGLRSDLVEQFRKHRVVSEAPPNYVFEDSTLYETHRGVLRTLRRLLNPLLKLFINPNPVANALHIQSKVNAEYHRRFRQREEMDPLFYEVIHNLVLEVTRLGIEVHNLTMRVESLNARVDFDERRARSLESVVQYRAPQRPDRPDRAERPGRQDRQPRHDRPSAPPASSPAVASPAMAAADPAMATREDDDDGEEIEAGGTTAGGGADESGTPRPDGQPNGDRKRRRRRRRRRPGQTMGDRQPGGTPGGADVAREEASLGAVREEGSPTAATPHVPGSAGSAPSLHTGARPADDDPGARDQ